MTKREYPIFAPWEAREKTVYDSNGLSVFWASDTLRLEGESEENARLAAAAPDLLNGHIKIDDIIHKHMGAIEAGEYSFETITEILVEIQNNSRTAIAKAEEIL